MLVVWLFSACFWRRLLRSLAVADKQLLLFSDLCMPKSEVTQLAAFYFCNDPCAEKVSEHLQIDIKSAYEILQPSQNQLLGASPGPS